jgi:hydrogenase maturation protein HypF
LLAFLTHSKTRHTGRFSIIRDFFDNRKSGSAISAIGKRITITTIAQQLGVVGEVYNNSAGVVIIIQCSQVQFNFFLSTLKNNIPTLASITNIAIEDCQINTYLDFNITHSRNGKNTTVVLPDACICAECINDITDKNNRRYGYAFTNCTNCGPRFSIIKKIPSIVKIELVPRRKCAYLAFKTENSLKSFFKSDNFTCIK